MTLVEILDQLLEDGWYVKISMAKQGPAPCWRVWLSWRQGDPPHKEASKRLDTLDEVATWLYNTMNDWEWDEYDSE